jgi:hypothetical protein
MEPILSTIANKLAGLVIGAAVPRIKRKLLGSDEERALAKAFELALTEAVDELAQRTSIEHVQQVEHQLREFLSHPEVAAALVDVALVRGVPDLEAIRNQLWSIGSDPESFPINVDAFVISLVGRLGPAMRKSASAAGSALFNEVALAELENIHTLLTSTAEPVYPRGMAPPGLPGLITGRDSAIAELKARLGVGQPGTTSMQVVTAVRGWPGVGKTTLATALSHDQHVRERFPDGVLWATLTRAERVAVELAAWGRALGLDSTDLALGIPELAERLRSVAAPQRMLIVIDDVWEADHAVPFLVGGPGSATIITTRLPAVAAALAAGPSDVYRLDVLDEESALELLSLLAPGAVEADSDGAHELVQALEGLPLALQVAGRLLQAESELGLGVAGLLAELREGVALLEAPAPADRHDLVTETTPTVAALLLQSTNRLDSADRERFALLGAFAARPATFDVDAMSSVWQAEDPLPTVRQFVQLGLLEPIGQGRFQMHALLARHAEMLLESSTR